MGKVEKLSPSPTYSKSGSKRSKMIVKAVRGTDENVTSQNASENTAMKMDETVETERETSETDENWQTVTNQRSNKVQKTNTHAPTTTMSFFGQTVPQNPKTEGVHSYFSFGGNDTRSNQISRHDTSQDSAPGESSIYVEGRKKQSEAQQKPMEIHVLDDLMKHNDRLNVNATSYSINPQSRHVLLVFANNSPTYEMLFAALAEFPSPAESVLNQLQSVTVTAKYTITDTVLVQPIATHDDISGIRRISSGIRGNPSNLFKTRPMGTPNMFVRVRPYTTNTTLHSAGEAVHHKHYTP